MRRLITLKLALVSVLIAACVTINVYFPAAAAEKAADRIIDTVTGGQPGAAQPQNSTPSNPQGSVLPESKPSVLVVALENVLNTLVPTAHAQGAPNLDLNTPEIRAVTASMQGRFAQLKPYLASGAVGLTARGEVEVRDQNAIPLPERSKVKGIVADENKDRAALYTEIAKANGHPEWEKDIRETFAKRWIAKAEGGWYYQEGGGWKQK